MDGILRPSFELDSPLAPDVVAERIARHVRSGTNPCPCQQAGGHLCLTVNASERRVWSPWLHIDVREGEQPDRSVIFARFSPKPALWTAVMLTYLALATACFFAVCFAISQWVLGEPPTLLWVLPPCAIVALTLLVGTRVAHRLAHDQMRSLAGVLSEALDGDGAAP